MTSGSGIIGRLLENVPVPRVIRIRQQYERPVLSDVAAEFERQLQQARVLDALKPGMSVAIGVGSRGVANQPLIVRLLVRALKEKNAEPFIFPAMGSHGGATADGQRDLLARMGVSEETTGAPIRATMDVVRIGTAGNGLPCWLDAHAAEADAVVVVNRIKPHPSFLGTYESGLMKMIAIGCGKQRGAEMCHVQGMGRMAENVAALGRAGLASGRILFGIGLLENAYHETCRIEVLPAGRIANAEGALLEQAKNLEPRILFDQLDVLIIDEIGKDIAGTGFDTHVVGRYHLPNMPPGNGPRISKIAALDITEASHGNGNGLGILDFTTERAFRKFSFEETYPNCLTSTISTSVKIPMVLGSDRLAIQAAIKTSNIPDLEKVRFGRIKNTLEAHSMEVSENLRAEALAHPQMTVVGDPYALDFDEAGNLF